MASSTSSQNSSGPKQPRGRARASSRRPERARSWRFTAPRTYSGTTKEQKPSLVLISRNAGDVHVYRHGRWSVAISAAGSLEALEFVQRFVEAALYGGLVTGELGKGVRFIRVTDEGSTERGCFRVSLGLHLLCFGEGFLALLWVRYRSVLILD